MSAGTPTPGGGAPVGLDAMTDDDKYLAVIDRMIDLEVVLRDLLAQLDAENELDDQRFKAIWPAISRARSVLLHLRYES